jgi:hypothetical protein
MARRQLFASQPVGVVLLSKDEKTATGRERMTGSLSFMSMDFRFRPAWIEGLATREGNSIKGLDTKSERRRFIEVCQYVN